MNSKCVDEITIYRCYTKCFYVAIVLIIIYIHQLKLNVINGAAVRLISQISKVLLHGIFKYLNDHHA